MASEWLIPISLVVGGLVVALLGKNFLKAVVMIVSGGLLGYAIYWFSTKYLHMDLVPLVVVILIGFIVGAFLGWFLVKLAIALATGFIVGLIIASLLGLTSSIWALVLVIILCIGLSYILAEKIVELLMAILGAAMVYYGILVATQPSITWRYIAIAIAALVFILAIYRSYRSS